MKPLSREVARGGEATTVPRTAAMAEVVSTSSVSFALLALELPEIRTLILEFLPFNVLGTTATLLSHLWHEEAMAPALWRIKLFEVYGEIIQPLLFNIHDGRQQRALYRNRLHGLLDDLNGLCGMLEDSMSIPDAGVQREYDVHTFRVLRNAAIASLKGKEIYMRCSWRGAGELYAGQAGSMNGAASFAPLFSPCLY